MVSAYTYSRDKNLSKELAGLVIPMAIQNLLVTVVNASDAIMLGALNAESLSAANLAGQLMQVYSFFIVALCVGTTILSAQYSGKEDYQSVRNALHITLQISILGGIIFSFACIFFPGTVMMFFTSDEVLIKLGSEYLRYVSGAYFFMGFSQVYLVVMKNIGKVRLSAIFGTSAVVTNLILNAVLIYGLFGLPSMGIKGAAIATTIARFFEFLFTLIESKKNEKVRFSIKELFRRHRNLERKYIRYTLPNVVQTMSWRVATTVNVAILGHMSSAVISANAVSVIIFDMMTSIAMAYASGCGILIGHALGRGELDKAKSYGDQMLRESRVWGLLLGIITCIITPLILSIAKTLSAEAISYLQIMLIILSIKMIGKWNNITLSKGIFVAGGDVKYHMKIDIINMWCVIVPLSLIAAFVLKLPVIVIYIIMNMDEYTKLYFEMHRYNQYAWVKNLTKKEWAEPGKYKELLNDYIIQNMPMGAFLVGSSGRISMVNECAANILGVEGEDIEGLNYINTFLEDPRNNDFAQVLIDSLDSNPSEQSRVVKYYQNDSCRIVQVKTIFVEEEDYNIGILVMINDLTNVLTINEEL